MLKLKKVVLQVSAAILCPTAQCFMSCLLLSVPSFQACIALYDDIEQSKGRMALALEVVAPLVLCMIIFIMWRLAVSRGAGRSKQACAISRRCGR